MSDSTCLKSQIRRDTNLDRGVVVSIPVVEMALSSNSDGKATLMYLFRVRTCRWNPAQTATSISHAHQKTRRRRSLLSTSVSALAGRS